MRCKKHLSLFLTALSLVCLFSFSTRLSAQFNIQVDYASSYIWRGFDLNPIKKPVLQPSVEYVFSDSGFSLNIWNSISFADKELLETDLTLDYAFKGLDIFSFRAGFIHYGWYFTENFHFSYDTSQELYLSAGIEDFFLKPALTLFYDFTNGDGLYILLETESRVILTESVPLHLCASLGYNAGQWLAEGAGRGFSDLNIGAEALLRKGKISLVPFVRWTIVLLDAIGDEKYFQFGVSLRISSL